jgi:hypothetical protein
MEIEMPLMCIQCAMKALANGEPVPSFEETSEQHMRRLHSDPAATKRERIELEQSLARKLKPTGEN